MTPHTVIIDACVLCSPLKRNIIAAFAEARFFQIRWSEQIMDETEKAVNIISTKHQHSNASEHAENVRRLMNEAFEDASVTGYESLGKTIGKLPDENDRHVIAAAIKAKAETIVTENLKDFPRRVLAKHGLNAQSSDVFIADAIDYNAPLAVATFRQLLQRLDNTKHTIETLLLRMENCGLTQAAEQLAIATKIGQPVQK